MKKSVLSVLAMLSLAACGAQTYQNPLDAEIHRINGDAAKCLTRADREDCLAANFQELKAVTTERLSQFDQKDPRRGKYDWVEPYKPGDELIKPYDPPSAAEVAAQQAAQRVATCINSYSCGILFSR